MGMSHVFYLKSIKVFFVSIRRSSGLMVHVVVPITCKAFHRLQLEDRRFIGSGIQVTRLRPYRRAGIPLDTAFQLSTRSNMTLRKAINAGDAAPAEEGEPIYFEGVVTEDGDASSGVVVLNRRILVVATSLCHVTNIRKLAKGQKVLVSRADRMAPPVGSDHKAVLVLNAKSFLRVETGSSFGSMHCKDSLALFAADTIVNAAQISNCDHEGVMALLRVKRALQEKFAGDDKILNKISHVSGNKNFLLDVMRAAINSEEASNTLPRSLVDDYLATDGPKNESKPFTRCKSIDTVANFKEKMVETLTDLMREFMRTRDIPNSDGINLREASFSSQALMGIVKCDEKSGRTVIEDSTGSIPICLPLEQDIMLTNCLVCVTNPVCVVEWSGRDDLNWECFFLSVPGEENAKVLLKAKSEDEEHCDIEWRVLCCSSSVQLGEDDKAGLLLLVHDNKANEFMHVIIDVALLNGHGQVPPGSNLLLKPDAEIAPYKGPLLLNLALPPKGPTCKFVILNTKPHVILPQKPALARDAFDLDDTAEKDISENELVTIEGRIAERWVEKSKFTFNSISRFQTTAFPRALVLHFKLGTGDNSLVSVYVSFHGQSAVPVGLGVNALARFSNVVKSVSKNNRVYFKSTIMTRIDMVELGPSCTIAPKEDALRLLRDIRQSRAGSQSFWCDLALQSVVKVSIVAVCASCGNTLAGCGVCTFAGCHAGQLASFGELNLDCKAVVTVGDMSDDAQVHIHGRRQLCSFLALTDADWLLVKDHCFKKSELLFLPPTGQTEGLDASGKGFEMLFKLRCQLFPQSKFHLVRSLVRKFKNDYDPNQDDVLKLYCLDTFMDERKNE